MLRIKAYLFVTGLALSIWVAAILINTLFVVSWMGFSKTGEFDIRMAGFIIYVSAMFSSPGLFILWFIAMRRYRSKDFFRLLMAAAFIGSLLSSLILAMLFFQEEIRGQSMVFFISPIAIALLSVLLHTPFIKLIIYKYHEEPCIEAL